HPELIKRVYSIKPFWGWAKAIAAAGLDYAKINTELLETLPCPFCGKELVNLCFHLRVHEITVHDYRTEYPGEPMLSEEMCSRISRALRRQDRLVPHWEPIWSAEYVLDRIHELWRRKVPLNSGYIDKKQKHLLYASSKFFKSWDGALRAAGLDPDEVRLADVKVRYNRRDVIREILKRRNRGLPMNVAAVTTDDLRLFNAARRRFGSYSAALIAAGIDPDKVRSQRLPYQESDRQQLLKAIRGVARIPEGKRGIAIQQLRTKYRKVVRRLFHMSWPAAAKAAGVPFRAIHSVDHRDFTSKDQVITALKDRLRTGKPLSVRDLKQHALRLYKALLCFFPKYNDWYCELGISTRNIRGAQLYRNPKEVLAAIRKRVEIGLGMRRSDLFKEPDETRPNMLVRRAREFFGSWSNALKAAGVSMEKRRPNDLPRYPTKESVLQEIRRRHREGLPLGIGIEKGESLFKDTALTHTARRYFGSWPRAKSLALRHKQKS
ncbi:hypothetical protein L0222_19280, partial [bacterium]|nr:hypothetical protein [bacterium]